jgi:hypothetical protein
MFLFGAFTGLVFYAIMVVAVYSSTPMYMQR